MEQPLHENTTGAEVAIQKRRQDINVFKAISLLPRPSGQNYTVYCYALSKEINGGHHGIQIYLGSFQTKEAAMNKVEHIIKTTGMRSVYVCNGWAPIDETYQPDRTTYIPDGKVLQEMEEYQRTRDDQELLKNKEIEQEILEESKKKEDSSSVEHYAYNWSVLIRNKATVDFYRKKIKELEDASEKRVKTIQTQITQQPHLLNDEWLNTRKAIMIRRSEEIAFRALEAGYKAMKEVILSEFLSDQLQEVTKDAEELFK